MQDKAKKVSQIKCTYASIHVCDYASMYVSTRISRGYAPFTTKRVLGLGLHYKEGSRVGVIKPKQAVIMTAWR